MRAKKAAVEIICLILIFYFFYGGVYKLAYFHSYFFWLHFAPLLSPYSKVLAYAIPIGEISLSILFLVPALRPTALYISIAALVLFVLWIMSVFLFTHRLFWPYYALWHRPTWMQKMLISIVLSWLALIAVLLLKGGSFFKRFSSAALHKRASLH